MKKEKKNRGKIIIKERNMKGKIMTNTKEKKRIKSEKQKKKGK